MNTKKSLLAEMIFLIILYVVYHLYPKIAFNLLAFFGIVFGAVVVVSFISVLTIGIILFTTKYIKKVQNAKVSNTVIFLFLSISASIIIYGFLVYHFVSNSNVLNIFIKLGWGMVGLSILFSIIQLSYLIYHKLSK